jgi:hypothetical protein
MSLEWRWDHVQNALPHLVSLVEAETAAFGDHVLIHVEDYCSHGLIVDLASISGLARDDC